MFGKPSIGRDLHISFTGAKFSLFGFQMLPENVEKPMGFHSGGLAINVSPERLQEARKPALLKKTSNSPRIRLLWWSDQAFPGGSLEVLPLN